MQALRPLSLPTMPRWLLTAGQGNVIKGIFEKLETLRSELLADVG